MKYKIELDEKQAQILVEALDLFSRIHMGQIEEVTSIWSFEKLRRSDGSKIEGKDFEEIKFLTYKLKKLLTGFDVNASYGISSPEVSDQARISFDILQVIRHKIAWDKNPKGGITVNFDKPMKTGSMEFIKIERMKDDE